MYDTPPTRLAAALVEVERSQSWLARKLGVKPQSIGPWIRGQKPCPPARQAQIVLFLNGSRTQTAEGVVAVAQHRTDYYFDGDGLAIREE